LDVGGGEDMVSACRFSEEEAKFREEFREPGSLYERGRKILLRRNKVRKAGRGLKGHREDNGKALH
jgi:hypothetical protein